MADGKVSILVDLQAKKAITSAKNLGKQISNQFKAIPNTFQRISNQFKTLPSSWANVSKNITSVFGDLSKEYGKIGKQLNNFGTNLSKVGNSLTSNITKPALVAGAAVAGITITKGLQRLIGIDTARAKLVGLGHDAKGVEAIMDSALQSVKGTAHGMDEAATTAANAVAAGVKEGEDLTKYLTITGDAAAIAGASMSDMGAILNSVRTSNKAYNGDLQQLSNRGLPVFQWLAEAAGVSAEAIVKMAADGKISSEMLMDAIDKNIGGAAKKMGEESFTAGLANMWAAVGRLGASFLDAGGKGGGFFSQLKPLITDMTNNIDTLGDWAAETGVKFGDAFTKMIEKVKEIISWYNNLSPLMQGIVKHVALFGSIFLLAIGPAILLVAKLVIGLGAFFTAISQISMGIAKLPALFAGIGKAITFLTGPIGLTIAAIIAAATLVYIYWEPISEFFIKLWDSIKVAWDATASWLSKAWSSTVDFFKNLWNGLVSFLQEWGLVILGLLTGPIGLAVALIYKYWEPIKGFFVDLWASITETWDSAVKSVTNLWNSVTDVVKGVWDSVVSKITEVYQKIITVFAPMISFFTDLFVNVIDIGANIFGRLSDFLASTWENIKTIATSGWELIKNVILAPILLLINLVTGDFEEFQSNLSAIWGNIKEHASNIWEAIKSIFVDYAMMIWENAKSIFLGLVDTIVGYFTAAKETIANIWEVITGVISDAWSKIVDLIFNSFAWIEEKVDSGMNFILDVIANIWNLIYDSWEIILSKIFDTTSNNFGVILDNIQMIMEDIWIVIENIWNFIKETFLNVLAIIKALVTGDFGVMKDLIGEQMTLIKDTISNIWAAIKNAFSSVLTIIKAVVSEAWNKIKSTTSNVFNSVWNTIKSIWNGIKTFFTQTLSNIWNTVKQKFTDIVKSVTDKMDETKQKVEDGWNKAVEFLKNIDLKQIGKDIIDGLINGITSKVTAVGDAIKSVTDKITGKIKGILGIHSPSRWMRDMIGKNMMLGWQIGIEREKKSSERMAEQATEWMTPEQPKVGGFVNRFKGITAPIKDVMSKVTTNHTVALAGGGMNTNNSSYAVEIVTNLDGKEIAREVVDDITELQNVKKYSNYKSRRKG